ncbi:MAG: LacI family DNA-binding transcriptional regulator [Kiritimatiellae bacterium]|nr:LacI family DNA-binding transcriptional regulator [Kiritimatiellia bacterium]
MTAPAAQPRNAKSADVATIVRQRIDKGIYDYQLPGMALLAEEMGLNERTVMRGVAILEGEGLVTRKRGRGTYITRLKRQRTHTIGAVIGSSSSPLGSQLTVGMQAAADEAREGLTQSSYVGDLDSQLPRIRDLIERGRVDGLVLWLDGMDAWREAIEYLQGEKLPFVLVPDYDPEFHKGVNTVSGADAGATADVMTHLLGHGHREIAFAGRFDGDGANIYHQHRYDQYCRSLKLAGLAPREGLRIGDSQSAPESDRELVAALREATAVFCETDRTAALIHRVCIREGIRVPHDLAIVGFDNSDTARWLDLTSVEQHFEMIGRKAVEVLLSEIEGNLTEPVHEEVHAELVIRGSSSKQESVAPGRPDPRAERRT